MTPATLSRPSRLQNPNAEADQYIALQLVGWVNRKFRLLSTAEDALSPPPREWLLPPNAN